MDIYSTALQFGRTWAASPTDIVTMSEEKLFGAYAGSPTHVTEIIGLALDHAETLVPLWWRAQTRPLRERCRANLYLHQGGEISDADMARANDAILALLAQIE